MLLWNWRWARMQKISHKYLREGAGWDLLSVWLILLHHQLFAHECTEATSLSRCKPCPFRSQFNGTNKKKTTRKTRWNALSKLKIYSSTLRPGTKAFTCGKWIICYNFGIDDGAESKFRTHKELIVLNILKYRHCVNKSRDMLRDHFAKNRKLLTNWWSV